MYSKLFLSFAFALLTYNVKFTLSDSQYILVKSSCSYIDFDTKTSYSNNLNKLLSSFPKIAGQSTTQGYYTTNTTYLLGVNSGNTIYGLFICRGDTTPSDCQGCVSTAVDNLPPKDCQVDSNSTVIWYDKCMVRYSNQSFLGDVDETIALGWKNDEDISSITSDVEGFTKLAGDTINNVASQLSSTEVGGSELGERTYYLTKDVGFNSYVRLYAMAQCTPDLNPTDCGRCLSIVINEMSTYCNGSKGCRMLNPSCNARYEIYHFYRDVSSPTPAVPPLPSSPLPPPSLSPPLPLSLPPQGMHPPPFTTHMNKRAGPSKTLVIYISFGVLILVLVVLVTALILLHCKKRKNFNEAPVIRMYSRRNLAQNFGNVDEDFTVIESLQYDFATLQYATNNFSENRKLGEGGFGAVYKGTLPSGQDIAVKRLSKDSPQGAEQFKNEVVFVAKLQHKNLVRLLGFCIAPNEKLLVYEFVPNKSLDVFLFDREKQGRLGWSTRYKIIHGIARGILYLHEDSRLKIIHRDLKASNVLLDDDMNPKVSDFGLARNFAVNQKQDQTSRLAGTLGYMAPEYIEYGEISTKSDVYSFGALVLEIITGKKISHRQSLLAENLLTYVWRHWNEGIPLEVVDASLEGSYSRNEVIRCLHLGLLCVQGNIEERPSMLSVVAYLNSSFNLPTPKQPAFVVTTPKGSSSETREPVSDKSSKSVSSSRTTGQRSDKSSKSIDSFSGIEASSH